MKPAYLVEVFELEAATLEAALAQHPLLRPFFSLDFSGKTTEEHKRAYLGLLKLTADYVRYSVPMLRAAGLALRDGDEEDRRWGRMFLGYAEGETDLATTTGHHVWAWNDMKALGATAAQIEIPPSPCVLAYGEFFVDQAWRHPYAILGAKGVLEHLSLRVSDALVRGVLASGIDRAEAAVSFFQHHGSLDQEHVLSGDRNLEGLVGAHKRAEVLTGAYFASGSYRAFLHFALEPLTLS